MCRASQPWSGSKFSLVSGQTGFSLVSGHHGPCFGCSASCVWRVSRELALDSRLYLGSTGLVGCSASCVWRVSRGLALDSRLYLVSTGRILGPARHMSGEWVVVWLIFSLVFGRHGPVLGCRALFVWRVGRVLARILTCVSVARTMFWLQCVMTWYTHLSLVDLAAVNYSAGMESCCDIFLVCVLIARAGVRLSSVIRMVHESGSVFSRRDVVLGVICADICAIFADIWVSDLTSEVTGWPRILNLRTICFVLSSCDKQHGVFPRFSTSLKNKSAGLSIFCHFDILRAIFCIGYFVRRYFAIWYFATSIFCVRYFTIRHFALRYFVRNPVLPYRRCGAY